MLQVFHCFVHGVIIKLLIVDRVLGADGFNSGLNFISPFSLHIEPWVCVKVLLEFLFIYLCKVISKGIKKLVSSFSEWVFFRTEG